MPHSFLPEGAYIVARDTGGIGTETIRALAYKSAVSAPRQNRTDPKIVPPPEGQKVNFILNTRSEAG